MFKALSHRPFRMFASGVFAFQTGYEMQNVALSWYMYQLTGSALSLGLMGLARVVPVFIFALIAGHTSDTRPRRRILVYTNSLLFVISCTLTILAFLNLVSPTVIYLVILANSTALTFASPASQALLPALLPRHDYQNAISINSMGYKAAMVMGPSIAGFIIARFGVPTVLAFNIFCIAFYLMNVILIGSFPQELSKATEGRLHSIKAGLRFVKNSRLIWSSMLLDFFATFFGSGMTLMPVFAADILKVGPEGLGLLYAAPSIGGIIAGLIFSSRKHIKKQGYILMVSVFFYGIGTVLFGFSNIFLFSLVMMAVVGAADMVSSIIRSTLRQMVTPDHMRGRMVSINMMFYLGGPQLGEVESGLMASLIGTPYTVVIGGIATIIATVFFTLRIPELLEYES